MRKFAEAALDAVLARPADELIGALFVGLALSLCSSGAYMASRRRVADPMPLLVALTLLVSVASATLAVGYLRYSDQPLGGAVAGQLPPRELEPLKPRVLKVRPIDPPRLEPLPGRQRDLARLGFEVADEDHDGILSPEEEVRMRDRLADRREPVGPLPADIRAETDDGRGGLRSG